MQMLIRADDVGYSEAVNHGIARTVCDGLIRTVGVMPNMPSAAHGLRLLAGQELCIGQHTNVCLGKPCADPGKIPSLLDENGDLKSSRLYREAWRRGEEFAVTEELVLEIEAQYFRFKELAGREPDYFEAHAVQSSHLAEALAIVAKRYHLRYNDRSSGRPEGAFAEKPIITCAMRSMEAEYDPWQSLKDAVAVARDDMPNVFVCHPGYLDAYLLRSSSLTVNRTKEVEMLCDPAVKEWLDGQNVELITYNDI